MFFTVAHFGCGWQYESQIPLSVVQIQVHNCSSFVQNVCMASDSNPNLSAPRPWPVQSMLHSRGFFHSLLVNTGPRELDPESQVSVQAGHLHQIVQAANAAAAEREVLSALIGEYTGKIAELQEDRDAEMVTNRRLAQELEEVRARANKTQDQLHKYSAAGLLLYDALCMANAEIASKVTGLTPKAFARSAKFTAAKVEEAINAWCDL